MTRSDIVRQNVRVLLPKFRALNPESRQLQALMLRHGPLGFVSWVLEGWAKDRLAEDDGGGPVLAAARF